MPTLFGNLQRPFDLAERLDLGLKLLRTVDQLLHEPIDLANLLSQLSHQASDLALNNFVPALTESILLSRSGANESIATLQQLGELAAHRIRCRRRWGPEASSKIPNDLLVERIGFGFALGLGIITHPGRIENAQRDLGFPERQGQPQMVGPGGFEDKLHRARIFFGCLDQLTEACMVIAQLRWQVCV